MKRKSLALLAAVAVLLMVNVVRAETNENENEVESTDTQVSITPKMKEFREDAKELRETNQEKRKELLDQNKLDREDFREQRKTNLEQVKAENKMSREATKAKIDALLKDKTPEEKLTIMPSVNALRKDLNEQNRANIKSFTTTEQAAKKGLVESIQLRMDTFRQSVRTGWTTLWSSVFGKK